MALTIPNIPLSVQQPVKPLVMLVSGKDHRLFYEAYNDASDIDGDGTLDIRFKPLINYLGLFNSDYCYTYSGDKDTPGLFSPAALAQGAERRCDGKKWSGNWLNYVTTSRIDALRVVLYGGMREIDEPTETVLRRAYIPQDAHSWAKEYTSEAVDQYKISDYTPLAQPANDKRHFFGSLTPNAGQNCDTLDHCSNLAPWLSVVKNSTRRVWEWASSERPVLNNDKDGGVRKNYTVRVRTCSAPYLAGCKRYANGGHKPVGLLHEYGENDAMLFGLLTGSYDNSMAGGRLRKVISSFSSEVDAKTGQFTEANEIVRNYDALRIRDFNNGTTRAQYRGGWLRNDAPEAGEFPDWGNPIGEMMYETLRYFAGRDNATPEYGTPLTVDESVGLKTATWDDPYDKQSAAKAPYCARANMLVISDVNVSYDSDQVPSSEFSTFKGDLPGFHAESEADAVSGGEPGIAGSHFIGQSGAIFDSAPTPKHVTSLGSIRGLAPEEPTKQGSYYSAAAAAFGKRTDLRPDHPGKQSVDSFVVALASPLPRIDIPMPDGKRITLVPFGKSVKRDEEIKSAKGEFQPTNQIVDFYVEQIVNSGPTDADPAVNGGRYKATFRISFEDVEQGADHDMDAVVSYEVQAHSNGEVTVTTAPHYQSGGTRLSMGYVISGTTADGVYLEVQDEAGDLPYFLNTPPGERPGFCETLSNKGCGSLPTISADPADAKTSRTFRSGTKPAATLLPDPLWYAAKWGGFTDRNGNDKPDLPLEWDADRDGTPDSYLLVLNPTKLKSQLQKALESIMARVSSSSNVAINSTGVSAASLVFQATYNTRTWSGDVAAYAISDQALSSTATWNAAQQLPPWQARNIFMNGADKPVKWTAFDKLSEADQELLASDKVFDYLRGSRSREVQNGGNFRNRDSVLGDIVHSSPFYDQRTKTLFVGSNDGALHAFDSRSGSEVFAFVPRAAASQLARIADPAYTHAYLVDGDVLVTSASPLTNNRSYLYGLMGRGGRGLFSLDVTEPAMFSENSFLWEYTPAGSEAARDDRNLGYMLGRPVLATLANGKLGLIAGNGYNSENGRAALYIFIINPDGSLGEVRTLDTGADGDNGLAGPAVVDINNDGRADFVYAGDLKGNVWKFDLRSTAPSDWRIALDGRALFTATGPQGQVQPITAPMYIARKPRSSTGNADPHAARLFAFFGTGAYFKLGDPTDQSIQTWWGVLADSTAPIPGRQNLRQRLVEELGTVSGRTVRVFSRAEQGDMANVRGWYIDLTKPVAGERIVTASAIVDATVPALLVSSIYPITDDPCIPGGRGFLNAVDPFTGAAAEAGILDLDRDLDVDNDRLHGRLVSSVDPGIGLLTEGRVMRLASGGMIIIFGGSGDPESGESRTIGSMLTGPPRGKAPPGAAPIAYRGRLSWREIVKE